MNDMYLFIVFAASAYVLQAVISWKQLKHFNQTYSELRRKGKVAIGKRPGKIRSG
ncbi:TPA: transcriptional regulator, partial [Enterococcus faecium]|nr:transcriptional regulator [Enterococcus faecium]